MDRERLINLLPLEDQEQARKMSDTAIISRIINTIPATKSLRGEWNVFHKTDTKQDVSWWSFWNYAPENYQIYIDSFAERILNVIG